MTLSQILSGFKMNKLISILMLSILTLSCGPGRHVIPVEMRYPSKAGVELAGKILSVVYTNGDCKEQDSLNLYMASAFANALEEDYGTGEGSVGLYSVAGGKGDYGNRDSLLNLLITTDADLVFLFDIPDVAESSPSSWHVTPTLYCYDGMDKGDRVHVFTGTTVMTHPISMEQASEAGRRIAGSFFSQWKHEQYSIAYYDSVKWYEAVLKAEQYDWKGAMDMWMTLISTNDLLRRSCAAYNIATACYMLGEYDLALEWLDQSDKDNKLPYSDALRKRINERRAF